MSVAAFDPYRASSRTGLFAVPPTSSARVSSSLTPSPGSEALEGILNPRNPLFWFGAILAATLGLMAATGAVRVGPVRAGASIGKT